jgi:hypothetical protein
MNPQKLPIPQLEVELARLKRKKAHLDKYIADFEAYIERRKALPDEIPKGEIPEGYENNPEALAMAQQFGINTKVFKPL